MTGQMVSTIWGEICLLPEHLAYDTMSVRDDEFSLMDGIERVDITRLRSSLVMMADTQLPLSARTVWWEEDRAGNAIRLLDQSLLPHEVRYLSLHHEAEVAEAAGAEAERGAGGVGWW